MSLRGTKRASGVRGEEPGTSKRRRLEPDDPLWQLRPVSDLKMSSIYNRSASEAPAELFRKDLISAMKLPDSEPLTSSEYWVITDTWKQDWERGVQVPVNPDSLPAPKVKIIDNPYPPNFPKFKLPKDKYIHLTRDANYLPDKHFLSTTPARAEAACNYDLDATDTAWLKMLNAERARAGAPSVSEDQLEKVIEELEVRTWDKIQAIMKSEEGLGIEYDENVICDVCRSPDSEDGNEMVFCDSCNICVHQACYGITLIPDGQWLCRPCGVGVKPICALCPNLGGAMKCTPSGHKWAHVSCVLWIPEVSIGCAEKMEPITKITSIPASRWSLVCVLCRERKGACIQCSVKTCKTAYHVTCAFKHGLEMRAIIEDENADDGVKLRSYCQKHSVNSKKEKCPGSGSEEEEVKRKRRKDMTSEEKTQARAARLQEIEREFDRHVTVKDISSHLLDIDQDAINYIYNYWKLKRRAGHNRPLLPPKSDENELLTHRQEQADLDKMKMFVQLRQDLERVRNLCYMVSRREKLSRSFFRMREQTFHKQVAVLTSEQSMSGLDLQAIIEANHGPSIYDRLYSHPNAPDHKNDFEVLLARIAPQSSCNDKKPIRDRNGLIKGQKSSNPYKKLYVNGSRRSGSMYSGLSSEESAPEIRFSKYRNRTISSTDDDVKKNVTSPKKKVSPKSKVKKSPKKPERKKKKVPQSKAFIDSSSSDDETIKTRLKKDRTSSKTLRQMEKEMTAGKMGQSGTDSDELMPMRTRNNNKFPVDIYSDSSDEMTSKEGYKQQKNDKTKTEKTKSERGRPAKSPKDTDSQQSLPRTKAAMKEFVHSHGEKKTPEEKPPPKKRGRKPSNKEKKPIIKSQVSDDEVKVKGETKFSKQKDNPTDLIVPQRQAAKKASENMRSTTAIKKEETGSEKQVSGDDSRTKPKLKSKGKETKDIPAKVGRKKSTKEQEKEPIAYVPQRQAAKKAAAHIKSGLGTKPLVPENADPEKRKDSEKSESTKLSPRKEDLKRSRTPPEGSNSSKRSKTPPESSSSSKRSKTPTESSSSSKQSKSPPESSSTSSNTSSSSYTSSSSSDDEPEKPGMKPTAKAREIKPAIRQPSMFSPPGTRPTVDLPFLDKVSRPLSSTSASSDSESSRGSRFSGSESPTPKRPRRRRKAKSISTDVSPRKAPDKKLKTSERESECRVSSPVIEREESNRPSIARAATRARTRSTTSSGNMPNKPDARPRKSSKDDSGNTSASSKTSKESGQSSKLQTPKRKTDEEIKKEGRSTSAVDFPKNDPKNKIVKTKPRSVSVEDKGKPKSELENEVAFKTSPRKSTEMKLKTLANRRMSVRDIPTKDIVDIPEPKARCLSKYDGSICDQQSVSSITKTTITTALSPHGASMNVIEKKHTDIIINDDFSDNDKNWLPKATSPKIELPAVEKPGGREKYMTEDKSMDSDSADKNSIKMIAKIQANLNENTMIKSPKTPMDARTIAMDHIDVEPSTVRKRRCSILDIEKKFLNQDQNLVQGVEISKSAKIPSAVNQFPNRAMFSPHSKDNEYFAFDMMAVDDGGFNNEDMIRPFTSYPEFFFKEDSKDQGAQETLNLVDRLRMQLSSKKAPSVNSQDEIDVEGEDKEQLDEENPIPLCLDNSESEIAVMKSATQLGVREDICYSKEETCNTVHETVSSLLTPKDAINTNIQSVPIDSNEKWADVPLNQNEPALVNLDDSKYDTMGSNSEDGKELSTQQSDLRSVSEIGDAISLSKQSDDSQPISVVDHSVHSNDIELAQDNQNYENNNSVIHSDCVAIASPYVSQRAKWTESKITTRRSSASSTNSEASICLQKPNIKTHLNSNDLIPGSVIPEIDAYPPLVYPCRVDAQLPTLTALPPLPPLSSLPALPSFTGYPSDASPFLGTMGSLPLFATGACASSQLQLPSQGPGLYAPGLAYHGAPLLQPLPKPAYTTLCAAAFTSSSQNIALTTAMIAPPTPKPLDSPRDDNDASGSDKASIHVVSSPSISVDSFNENSRAPTKLSNDSDETNQSTNTQEPKSPSKSIKSLTKFHGKSPGKSPDISPKQADSGKSSKRSSNRSSRSHRGRGRSKSRGQGFSSTDFSGIQSKLVGTVYDFDEEIANDGVDIKALRDRRKSIESREDRSEHSYKDSSQSPSLSSPKHSNKRSAMETKEIKASTPDISEQSQSPTHNAEHATGFSDVRAVLPGPVDMRTYSFDKPPPTPGDAIHSHLLAFASGTADQHIVDIDEEVEKQLHTDLMESKRVPGSPQVKQVPEVHEPIKEVLTPQLPKVSLSDSRNQLKVKIKGPFLDANYSASSVQPVAPQPPPPVHDSNTNMFNASNTASSSMMTGSNTNLRRMRKKELLRQYWTQDMNMDDPTNTSAIGIQPPPAAPQPLARAVITIPKAVASMTSIPTREDYKIIETPLEKKKRKSATGLSRELRHLEVSMNDDVDTSDDMKLSTLAGNSSQTHKRRPRVAAKPNRSNATSPIAPKLKIKISSNVVQQVNEEPLGCQFRPPKKRLTSIPKPSLEDLRRESMKYRRKVMADFEEDEKTKKYKTNKSEKRKKKKEKKSEKEKLRIINSESESATKLIIKIKRTKDEESSKAVNVSAAAGAVAAAVAVPEPSVDAFEYFDPTAVDPLAIDAPVCSESANAVRKVRTAKVTPIRLKLSRSSQGSGYVMKEAGEGPAPAVAPASPLPVAVSKHCEVR